MNLTAIFLAALAALGVGGVWYGLLFGKLYRRIMPVSGGGAETRRIIVLAFLCELLSATMLAHNFVRLGDPAPHIKMMIATGLALAFVIPAIGVTGLQQRRPGMLFLIDAGHWLLAYAAMGAVFVVS